MDANQKANLQIVKIALAFVAAGIGVVLVLVGSVYVISYFGIYNVFKDGVKAHEDAVALGEKYHIGARVAGFMTDALKLNSKNEFHEEGGITEINVVPDMQDIATKDEIARYLGPLHLSASNYDEFKQNTHVLELEFPKLKSGSASITYSSTISPELSYSCDIFFKDGVVTKFLKKNPAP
jgi:hypothetical protein